MEVRQLPKCLYSLAIFTFYRGLRFLKENPEGNQLNQFEVRNINYILQFRIEMPFSYLFSYIAMVICLNRKPIIYGKSFTLPF